MIKTKDEKLNKEILILTLQAKGGIININGQCMLPTLENNCKVEIQPISTNDIVVGDIIAFRSNNDIIVHRIVKIISWFDKKYFFQRGDNAAWPLLLNKEAIVGKVVKIFREQKQDNTALKKYKINYPKTVFFIIYLFLLKLKIISFGKKRYKLTSFCAFLFWKIANII